MGLNAYLTVIARSEYRKYPRVNPAALAQFDLNKVVDAAGTGIANNATTARFGTPGDRSTVEEFEDGCDAYDAFVTPAMVRRISVALAGVSDEELIAALKSVGFAQRKREHPEHVAFFERLKAAYQEAAKQDAYLRIFI